MLKNARWELFCNATLTEPTLGDAFIKAFPHAKAWKRKTVQERASVLAKRDKIQTRINELKQELVKRTLWTRESSVKVLARIALKGERDSDKISSIKELNAMHGFNAPIEHNVKADLSHAVDLSEKDFDTLLAINDALKALPRE
jgi:tmRNA-binding protein